MTEQEGVASFYGFKNYAQSVNETVRHIDIFYFEKKVHNHDSFSFNTKLILFRFANIHFTVLLLKDKMYVKIQSFMNRVVSFPKKTSTV